jgi:glutamine synthetase
MQIYKYIVKNVAVKHGKTATFMPKPLFEDNAVRVRMSIKACGKMVKPLFAGDKYAGLSHRKRSGYVGGILKHINSTAGHLCADDEQLPPSCARLRGTGRRFARPATVRRPAGFRSLRSPPKAKRVEFRCPDPAANP